MALKGKEKIAYFILNSALAITVATGCISRAEAKPPALSGNERAALPSREVDCEDLGRLNMAPPSKEALIDGFRLRFYDSGQDLFITASARASVMNGSPTKAIDWKPNQNTSVEMDISQVTNRLTYTGTLIRGNTPPKSWETSTKSPLPDGCIVATALLKDGKIDPSQTQIHSLPGVQVSPG